MSSKQMGIEEARKRLGDVVTAVQQGTDIILTRNGKPAARIIAYKESPVSHYPMPTVDYFDNEAGEARSATDMNQEIVAHIRARIDRVKSALAAPLAPAESPQQRVTSLGLRSLDDPWNSVIENGLSDEMVASGSGISIYGHVDGTGWCRLYGRAGGTRDDDSSEPLMLEVLDGVGVGRD